MDPSAGRRALGKAQAWQRATQARERARRYSQVTADENFSTKAVRGKQQSGVRNSHSYSRAKARRLRAGAGRGGLGCAER